MKTKETMEYILDAKAVLISTFSAVMAFLYPISGDLHSMLMLFAGNFLFGLIAEYSNGGGWDKKKFWQAIKEALMFFAIVFFIYGIGRVKGQMELAQQCVSFVSWSLIYYYGTNIARNLKETFPKGTTAYLCASWLYFMLSVEFIKKIPYLSHFLKGESAVDAVDKEDYGRHKHNKEKEMEEEYGEE